MIRNMRTTILGHEDLLATRLKWLRKEILEMTQPKLAELLGVTAATISYWESEKSRLKPRCRMLIRISLTLGISIDYLFGLSDEPLTKEK